MTVKSQLAKAPGGILFVGDEPDDEDIVKGVPFAGSHGHLLSQAFRAAGLTDPSNPPATFMPGQRWETKRLVWERRAHSFTNLFDHQPGFPHLGKHLRMYYEQRAATFKEALDRLATEIDQCKPNLIVPLGGVALWALTGSANIDAYRGAIGVSTKLAPGVKILPSFHPRHILQQYKYLVVLISDLLKIKREVTFPEVRAEPKEIWLDPTIEDLFEFKSRYIRAGQGPLSVDIETGGGQISCVSLTPTQTHSIIVPFVDYRQSNRSYWSTPGEEQRAWEFLSEILADPTIEKLFQNGSAFDVFWFLDSMGISVNNYRHDLRVLHQTLFPELPKSLKFMGATHANVHAWKSGIHHQHQEEKRDA